VYFIQVHLMRRVIGVLMAGTTVLEMRSGNADLLESRYLVVCLILCQLSLSMSCTIFIKHTVNPVITVFVEISTSERFLFN